MAKVTKKMLTPLEKAELREIIVIGMELPPRQAYQLDAAASIKWIQERATDFAGVDLGNLGTDCFRDGVVDYLTNLQQYILGNIRAPKFPTDDDPTPSVEEAVVVEATEDTPVKKKRGRPKKEAVVVSEETVAATEAAPVKRRRGRPKKAEAAPQTTAKKKSGFKVKGAKPTEEPHTPKSLGLVKEEIETTSTTGVAVNLATDLETFASFQSSVDSLRAEVQALRTEQTAAFNMINNALVYILNTAIIEDDEDLIKDLTQLKS